MHLQIVMDSNGDARYAFDPLDVLSVATAEARFKELTGSTTTFCSRKRLLEVFETETWLWPTSFLPANNCS